MEGSGKIRWKPVLNTQSQEQIGFHRCYTWLRLEDVTVQQGQTGNQRNKGSKLTYKTYN